jgi:kynurenine formamidase
MRRQQGLMVVVGLVIAFLLGRFLPGPDIAPGQAAEQRPTAKGWVKGKGFGWIWGPEDEVGALNVMTPATVKAALQLAKNGQVYDLGIAYDRNSFKWAGHSPGEVLTYRSPEGVKRQGDFKPVSDPSLNPQRMAWHSSAIFINDNVGTQIDGLGHITLGEDNHWYNGFKEADWGGNFGIRKCDATTIPPIVSRGVLIDVAKARGVDALPSHFTITAEMLKDAVSKQGTELHPGDTVLIRTGAMRYWGKNGANHELLAKHDTAGIDLGAAKWLVEQNGAVVIGSDTSSLELQPGPSDKVDGFIPVHKFLLIEQGVHIGEFHFLEDLARDQAYEFCYVCMTNKILGTTAGFTLRPIAIR